MPTLSFPHLTHRTVLLHSQVLRIFTHIKSRDNKGVEKNGGRTELQSEDAVGKNSPRANTIDQAGVRIDDYGQDQVGVPVNHHG